MMEAKEVRDLTEKYGAESTKLDRELKQVTAFFDYSNKCFHGGIIVNCQNYAGGQYYETFSVDPSAFNSWGEFHDCIDAMNGFINALNAEGFREKRTP